MRLALLLLLASAGVAFDEEDFFCKPDIFLPSVEVCDGVVNCESNVDAKYDDESHVTCAPAPFLHHDTSLEARELTGTSVHLAWTEAPRRKSGHTLKLAGYLLTEKLGNDKIQRMLPKRLHAHKVEGLSPLTSYSFILRPYYTESGKPGEHHLIGKAAAVDVKTLSKNEQFCGGGIKQKRKRSTGKTFRVSSNGRGAPIVPGCSVEMNMDKGQGHLDLIESRTFNKLEKALSTYSILFDNLEPWTRYTVQLKACSEGSCKPYGERSFLTPPNEFPKPVVTEIESTHPGSFRLEWSFPNVDSDLYHGFRIRYCEENATTCSLVFTNETKFEANGLAYDTTFHVDVRAQLKLNDGIVKLGSPGKATVTTWTDVSLLMVRHKADFYDESGTSLLAWETVNSSVKYFQYRLDTNNPWISCNLSAECNITADYHGTTLHATGYMSVAHGKKYGGVNIGVHGCNDHGCGKEYFVNFVWHGLDYVDASDFRVLHIDRHAWLRWSQYGHEGFQITGICGDDWEVYYENKDYPYVRVDNNEEITVRGLPTNPKDCEFYIKTYRETGGLAYYSLHSEAYRE